MHSLIEATTESTCCVAVSTSLNDSGVMLAGAFGHLEEGKQSDDVEQGERCSIDYNFYTSSKGRVLV